MIQITQGQANTVSLSLREKQTLTTPYFLFRFVCDSTKQEKYFIAADTSSYPERANIFTITESASESLLTGTVRLATPGIWTYYVYEQSSSTNLIPANTTSMLESGLVKVTASAESTSYTNYGAATTYHTYRP